MKAKICVRPAGPADNIRTAMSVPAQQNAQEGGGAVNTDTAEDAPVSWTGQAIKNAGFMAQMAELVERVPVSRMAPPTKNVDLMETRGTAVLPAQQQLLLQKRLKRILKTTRKREALTTITAAMEEVLPLNKWIFVLSENVDSHFLQTKDSAFQEQPMLQERQGFVQVREGL